MVKPYYEVNLPYYTLRRFPKDLDEDFLVWHRDKENRKIKILEGTGWMLQLDDQLPVSLKQNEDYDIPKMVYHRIIKGDGDLILEIIKD